MTFRHRWPLVAVVALAVAPAGCDDARPLSEADCTPADPSEPSRFLPCEVGSGSFGRWIVDDQGLPAFSYEADQTTDERAEWELTTGEVRTDHLFQIGNDRLIVVLDNDGFAQVFTRDRMPSFLNRRDLDEGRTGGGYSFIAERDEVWATAYLLRPEGAEAARIYGANQAKAVTSWRGLTVTRRLITPPGELSFLIDEVEVRNDSDRRRELSHYEVWDVARHQLKLQLIRSGEVSATLPEALDDERDFLNRSFTWNAEQEGTAVRVSSTRGSGEPGPDDPAELDSWPHDIFLTRLLPSVERAPLQVHTRREAFYGEGPIEAPEAVLSGEPPGPLLEEQTGVSHPAVLVDQVDLSLAPGETARLRYAFGYAPPDEPLPELDRWRQAATAPEEEAAEALRRQLPLLVTDASPVLHREMAWHAGQLLAAATYDPCLGAHTVVQGSTYMYLHGLDGAARDYALFSVPLTYLRPDLARELLRTIMRMTYAEGDQISYAVQGCGVLEDAIIHEAPSDLDLFFLWALSEYVAATGDQAFLEELNPFWPPAEGEVATGAEHARRAFRHLIDQVGRGPHGLIRVGTGDWSDGIVFEADDQELAHELGESVPNTQMAAWVLPRAAGLLFAPFSPETAAEARAQADQLRAEAAEEWAGSWYRRAWFGPEAPYGEGHLNLEAQVWALIADIPQGQRRDELTQRIFDRLDRPSPVGARRVPGGMVWHAITGLLTWGYAHHAPEFAWRSLSRHSLAAYAEANPDQWYGTWSGPDALGVGGGTWGSPATPMGDWPVMNANQHAMPLLGLLRVAGIEPSAEGDGLRIAPRLPHGPLTLSLPVLRLDVSELHLAIEYRAATDGETVLRIEAPFEVEVVLVDGHRWEGEPGESVMIPLSFDEGDRIQIELSAR